MTHIDTVGLPLLMNSFIHSSTLSSLVVDGTLIYLFDFCTIIVPLGNMDMDTLGMFLYYFFPTGRSWIKLNYRKKVFFFALNFLPWEFLLIKKLEIEKTKTTQYTTFKTDRIKVVLVFSISNFFTNKKSQGRKLSLV